MHVCKDPAKTAAATNDAENNNVVSPRDLLLEEIKCNSLKMFIVCIFTLSLSTEQRAKGSFFAYPDIYIHIRPLTFTFI